MHSVLFISLMNSAAWGGSEEIWYHAALRLARQNFKIGICCFSWPGKEERIQELKNAGCEIYLLPGKNDTKGPLGKLKLKRKLGAVNFSQFEQIIVNQGGWKDIVHRPFNKLNSQLPPYYLLFHNYDETEHLSANKIKIFNNWVTKAEKNIGDAARIFPAIKKCINTDVPEQDVLFNPISFQQPANATSFTSYPENKLIFLMLAELDIKRKAQDQLINTLAAEKWNSRNFELHLYGKGKDKEYLERLIKEKQLSSKVFLKGFTKNVQDVLTSAHVILQLTHFDAMPIAITEALAVARPVIVSNVGDMPLWVKDEVNGWIAPQVKQDEIDIVLEKAWQNRSRLEEMGRSSFSVFKEKYPADPIDSFLRQTAILS